MPLEGKVALMTGNSQVLGKVFVQHLLETKCPGKISISALYMRFFFPISPRTALARAV